LTYTDPANPKPTVDPLTGEKLPERKAAAFADKLARHVVAGASLVPSESFQINLGYNYLRRQELKTESRPALTGFSFGFGLKVKKFHLSYARSLYHLAGAVNQFGVSTNFSAWK